MTTAAVQRPQPVFSPVALAAFVVGVGLMAWVVQYNVELPASLLAVLIGGIGLALFASGLLHPEIPLLALAAYAPFSKVLAGDFGGLMTAFNLTNLLMGVVLVGYVLRTIAQHRPLVERSPLNVPVVLFSALGAVSLIRGVLAGYGEAYAFMFLIPLKRWLTPILLYFIVYHVAQDRRTIRQLLVVMLLVVTIVALMAIKDYLDIGPNASLDKSRVGGIAQQPNILGAFFVYYMFLFAAFWALRWSRARAWLLLIPFALCFRGIMVTFSRGAYLAFGVGAVALAWFRHKLLWLGLVLAIMFAVANPGVLPKGIAYRMSSTLDAGKVNDVLVESDLVNALDTSAFNRLRIWEGAVRMIRDHPFLGVGYGAFPYLIGYYAPGFHQADAHNSYLIIAAEMGVPALLVFLWILAVTGWKTRWLYWHAQDPFLKAMALGWLAGLSGLLVANLFGSRLHSEEISSYFWILCGLIMRAVHIERRAA